MDGKPWRIELLSAIRARYRDGEWLPLSYQKPVALLLYLAACPHRPHPREALVEMLWPGIDPETGRNSLRVALYSLRRLLESDSASTEDLLLADRMTLRLNPAAFTTDLAEYLAAVSAAARAQTSVDRCQALGHAATCYTGEFLPGVNDAWAFEERERLTTTQRELLQRLVRVREELGDGEGALTAAREMVRLDPLWEEAHYEVMRLYAALGQPSACLRQYQELERVLREELNETPSAQVRALAEELRQGARSLVVARSAAAPAPPPALPLETIPLPAVPPPPHDPDLPGRPAAAPPSRLPPQLTRFYGREEEIARLTELLASTATRLVTVTGSGGSGKTRLALAAAERVVGADPRTSPFPEAVAFVSLADLADASRIPDAIAEALGLVRSPEVEVLEQVITLLSARPWLLVLDNFEHLIEEGALLVRRLLERAPRLTCLVTSRQRLGLSGEQEFALLPLPTPRSGVQAFGRSGVQDRQGQLAPHAAGPERLDAEHLNALLQYPSVQLFLDRARAAWAGFRITPENAAAVAELCDQLEGLPLAIELAAARAAILSPAQMLEQLARRFEFLVSRQRDLPARHRTLRAAIDTSFEALSPPLRQFFVRLSVFRGGWTLEAAAAVCAGQGVQDPRYSDVPGETVWTPDHLNARAPEHLALEYLDQLRDASLVIAEQTDGAVRYRLLETLREYAAACLSRDEQSALKDRHLAFFLALADRLYQARRGPNDDAGVKPLQRDYPNLQSAFEWSLTDDARAEQGLRLAVRLENLWNRRMTEGRRWLAAALERSHGAPHSEELRAAALFTAGHLAAWQNDLGAARPAFTQSLALWRQVGDRERVADTLVELARCARGEGDLAGAEGYLEECVAIRQARGDGEGTAWALENLAWIIVRRGEMDEAIRLLRASLAMGRACGALEIVAYSLHSLGWLAAEQGDLPGALALLQESLGPARELGRQPLRITHRSGILRAWQPMEPEPARQMLELSLAFNRLLGHQWLVMHNLGALGHIARRQGSLEAARGYYQESLRLRRELDDLFAVAQALEDLAGLEGEQGQAERATRLLGAAEALCETLGTRPPVAVGAAYDQTVAAARAMLGETVFAAAWMAGRAMSLEQAVDFALERSRASSREAE